MSAAVERFLKYLSVGLSTFILDLVVLFMLVDVWLLQQVWAAGIAFMIAVSINYWLSRRYVFKGTLRSVKTGYLNFIFIAFFGLLVVLGGMYWMTIILGWNYLLARTIVAILTGFWNYLMNLFVNFEVAGKH